RSCYALVAHRYRTSLLLPSSLPHPPRPTLFPYTTLFRSQGPHVHDARRGRRAPLGADRHVSHRRVHGALARAHPQFHRRGGLARSEEHTSELQSRENLVCRLLLEKKKKKKTYKYTTTTTY